MQFREVTELARKIYNLLSKLLQSVNSVKIQIIVLTVVSIYLPGKLKASEIGSEIGYKNEI